MIAKPTAIIYIDGFNLYYGRLRDSSSKWLDIQALFDDLLPRYDVIKVRYFTARVKAAASPADPQAPERQKAYLNALAGLPRVEVTEGSFTIHKSYARRRYPSRWARVIPVPRRLRERHLVKIWKVEEKGSDVNLGAYLVLDAARGAADLQVLVTNDSDLAEPARIVGSQFGQQIALCFPRKTRSRALVAVPHAFVLSVSDAAIARNQLPNPVEVGGKSYYRPAAWGT
ncbi:NYN domain-containing protein [Homoserinibacter sp. YIM 151385]|uniref:NYN domain-containing protein n=1 Tax=Homoserinibacter sp. YIM 151385 TaxID=2985506 RepID=UPI0022F0A52D|nr:NYN domain-containing protein [Homoserinibacter sp. YIM 151385]WBU36781.1 NYN domain-containing protein [Homoserinibacter sp. YIM 151385]